MSFFVYIHTCPNGKKYVGITTKAPEERWSNGKGYRHNRHFMQAIKKYGWDNIEHEFFETSSMELMFFWEMILIYHHKSNNSKYGYNKCGGGKGPNNLKHSEETKKRISEAMKGIKFNETSIKKRIESRKGFKHSEETKKRISEAKMGTKMSEEHKKVLYAIHKGSKHSEETKRKISEARKLYWENKRKNNT